MVRGQRGHGEHQAGEEEDDGVVQLELIGTEEVGEGDGVLEDVDGEPKVGRREYGHVDGLHGRWVFPIPVFLPLLQFGEAGLSPLAQIRESRILPRRCAEQWACRGPVIPFDRVSRVQRLEVFE